MQIICLSLPDQEFSGFSQLPREENILLNDVFLLVKGLHK
jgi:hypothetical protein